MDAFRNGAAGVVSSAKLFRPEDFAELTTITASRYRARASRPSAALSQLLLDAAASPPLRGGEYSTFNISSIHSHSLSPPRQLEVTIPAFRHIKMSRCSPSSSCARSFCRAVRISAPRSPVQLQLLPSGT